MRRRLIASLLAGVLVLSVAAGCGEEESDVPTSPDVSRAQPTGTVNTTVPR